MKEEIKEILEDLDKIAKGDYYPEDLLYYENCQTLLDYITNLQQELEGLKEDNYAYHQLMKMQNKREYRSKFLKEFQEEFGTNTFPDYDEIYKRYDKLKKENERLKEELKNRSILDFTSDVYKELEDYKQRIDKAIEYIENEKHKQTSVGKYTKDIHKNLLKILGGDE